MLQCALERDRQYTKEKWPITGSLTFPFWAVEKVTYQVNPLY